MGSTTRKTVPRPYKSHEKYLKHIFRYHRRLRRRFHCRPIHTGFGADKVAPGQVLIQVLRFFPVNIIPPVLHTHSSFIYHRCQINLVTDSVVNKTLLSVSHISLAKAIIMDPSWLWPFPLKAVRASNATKLPLMLSVGLLMWRACHRSCLISTLTEKFAAEFHLLS